MIDHQPKVYGSNDHTKKSIRTCGYLDCSSNSLHSVTGSPFKNFFYFLLKNEDLRECLHLEKVTQWATLNPCLMAINLNKGEEYLTNFISKGAN